MSLTERDERRFWSKVALPDGEGCMLWLKYTNRDGYGTFWVSGGMRLAHRVSYAIAYGDVPEGLEIDHVKAAGCTNRHCVAPLHLEAVTHSENLQRGSSAWAAKTHCPRGHPYDEANTYVWRGGRHCRTCNRLAQRRRLAVS